MKNILRLIRRFIGLMILSFLLLLLLNMILIYMIASDQVSNASPWKTAQEAADAIHATEDGYSMSAETLSALGSQGIWGILIDNGTLEVIWQTKDLPDSVPLSFTASDIASFTRGYLSDYPTFPCSGKYGLMVLGYPKTSFWKHMWPSWDYQFISRIPYFFLGICALNLAAVFLIYVTANARLLSSVRPITNGIQALPTQEAVHVREKGLLSDIANCINRTSEILQAQKYQLQKKETARADWIAGVSHDIRTPLSMVMGYADQLKNDDALPERAREKASIILRQSKRIRDLVSDLNLSSRLEYNMQPLHLKEENAVAVLRQAVTDFINDDIDHKHPIKWLTEETFLNCPVMADAALLMRAVSNLIQNCIRHNENGCTIFVSIRQDGGNCLIRIEDDGIGASKEKLQELNASPGPNVGFSKDTTGKTDKTDEWDGRHGLGLLLVKQIISSHGGSVLIGQSGFGGFAVTIRLPCLCIHREAL